MKYTIGFAVWCAGLTTTTLAQDVIGRCGQLAYADGGIWCGGCQPELEHYLGHQRYFPLNMVYNPDKTISLARKVLGQEQYTKYRDHMVINTSPGAFAPVKFTADLACLAPGETIFALFVDSNFPVYSPTGSPVYPLYAQGWQMVQLPGYSVEQLYWNQTLWETTEPYAAGLSGTFPELCWTVTATSVVQGNRPF